MTGFRRVLSDLLLECANTGWRSCICLDLFDAVLVALVGLVDLSISLSLSRHGALVGGAFL